MITKVGFPDFKPSGKSLPFTEELTDAMQRSIKELVSVKGIVNVLEIGSMRGDLSNFLTDLITGTIVSIGNWGDKSVTWNNLGMETAQTEWETFCINCWPSRLRIIPVETDSLLSSFEWVKKNRFIPDMIWIHSPNTTSDLLKLITEARENFPNAIIMGSHKAGVRLDTLWLAKNGYTASINKEIWCLG